MCQIDRDERALFDALIDEGAITDIEHLRMNGVWRLWRAWTNGKVITRKQDESAKEYYHRVMEAGK